MQRLSRLSNERHSLLLTGLPADVPRSGSHRTVPHRVRRPLSLAVERQKELPQRHVSQLAARVQRGANDVCHRYCENNGPTHPKYPIRFPFDALGNPMVESSRRDRGPQFDYGLFVPRLGPQRNEQLLSNQVRTLYHPLRQED